MYAIRSYYGPFIGQTLLNLEDFVGGAQEGVDATGVEVVAGLLAESYNFV